MHLERLSKRDSQTVGELLRAPADGPFFPDWEFHTLFGLDRDQVRKIADDWPLATAPPENVVLAVNNSINNLLGYPHRKNNAWGKWISVDQNTIRDLFDRLRGQPGESYFDKPM
jgi:hypothetical protein